MEQEAIVRLKGRRLTIRFSLSVIMTPDGDINDGYPRVDLADRRTRCDETMRWLLKISESHGSIMFRSLSEQNTGRRPAYNVVHCLIHMGG